MNVRQPHKNLFFFYRGSLPKGNRSALAFDRQLEDNATKALVYVLEHANPSQVLVPFLAKIIGIRGRLQRDEIQFALQRVDIARPSIRQQIALSIAPSGELNNDRSSSHVAGRPDAWIWSENSFAILVETKVNGQASYDQLRRHVAGAQGWSWKRVQLKARSWSELYAFFQDVRCKRPELDPVTRLLLDEFVRYIRMIGLASTTTFDLEDFGYFLMPPKDRHKTQRELLKRKLNRFAEDLGSSKTMHRVIKRYAGTASHPSTFVQPGKLQETNYWITLGRKERRNSCHFTVRLNEEGISLEVFAPHKSFTKQLIEKIKNRPADFLAALSPMKRKSPYFIRLREAYYHDPDSRYKGQRIGSAVDYLEIHPQAVTINNFDKLIIEPVAARLNKHELRPEIFLVRKFKLSELVGNSKVVDMVVSAAAPMLKYLEFALD
ncbi:MAG: hypothetical protein ACYC7L_04540 [Nitrospirota bacterium]